MEDPKRRFLPVARVQTKDGDTVVVPENGHITVCADDGRRLAILPSRSRRPSRLETLRIYREIADAAYARRELARTA